MNSKVDARGLACPKPVIETKKALDKIDGGVIITIVDNKIAKENVQKLAKSMNYQTEVKELDSDFHISISKDIDISIKEEVIPKEDIGDFVVFIGKDKMGTGADELGDILMRGYIYTLTEAKPYPKAILFVNRGVNLTVNTSEVLEDLKILEDNGVQLLSCGTCLDYYGYKDKLAIGEVTNMFTIVEMTNTASNTITI